MKFITLVLSCFLVSFGLTAQNYNLVLSIPIEGSDFTTDPLGNCYIYSKGDVTKFNTDGIETGRFSTREFGDISLVDATNPLKILIVFREFSTAIVLDASLSPQATIDLSFPGVPYVNVIATSREDGYWIVDPVAKQIKKINDQLAIVSDGTPFRQVSSEEIEAKYLVDSGDWLIIQGGTYGVLIFDRFGTYFKTIPGIPVTRIQASGHELLYKENTGMVKMDLRTGATDKFLLPENGEGDYSRVEGNRIFLKTQNLLKIYTY
ncbi:MAG: hypothetical protein M3Q95_01385 [Bacteroidota bacterium]|nr:hypothetical protein [Bacteroidota bacterium]